jgi:DNA-binding MarR family transcriptional regulator
LLVPFEKANIATPSRAPVKVETDLEIAQRIVKKRAEREELFGLGLFTDPAWDVLLDLFIAREAGRKISISSVCVAARVPASTALRWIRELERRKLVVRITDAADRRRSYLVLTDESQMKISHLLKNIEAGTI